MRTRRSGVLFACLVLSTAVSESRADDCVTGTPAVSFSFIVGTYSTCNLPSVPGVTTLTIQITGIPVQRVRFALADPPIGTVIAEAWSGPHSGDRQTGIEVDLGCTSGWPITVGQLTIEIAPGENIPCTPWEVSASEVQDCEGLWRPGTQVEEFYAGGEVPYTCPCSMHSCMTGYPPYDLYPPDGATNVPLDVVLTWTDDNNWPDPIYMPGPHGCYVYITTRADCVSGGRYDLNCDGAFAPDFLEPGRTYYWYPAWWLCCATGCDFGLSGSAPLHSFTTEGTLPVTPTTWGKVKSLYRD